MIVVPLSIPSNLSNTICFSSHHNDNKTSTPLITPLNHVTEHGVLRTSSSNSKPRPFRFCSCGRRHLLEAAVAGLLSVSPANASDYKATLNRVHPPRPDWYEEFYASILDSSNMKRYEAEIAAFKSKLFANLRGKAKKVLEIGIGTGPNLKYYAGDADVEVFGVDPNAKMEKYAQEAAFAAGLQPANFNFIQAVGEALPLNDASVDAVIGTLVLCSVTDVDQTLQGNWDTDKHIENIKVSGGGDKEVRRVLRPGGLYLFVEHVAAKDGTLLRFLQNVLDPLQQTLVDGCHLTRETGKKISEAGFSGVDFNTAFLSNAAFLNPQVYGIANK